MHVDPSLSDPEYCTRYYRCSHGMDEIFECPRGTAWDEVTKSCAWVDQVNCDQKKLGYSTSTSTEGMNSFERKPLSLLIPSHTDLVFLSFDRFHNFV